MDGRLCRSLSRDIMMPRWSMTRRGILMWRLCAGLAMATVLGACARSNDEAAFTERVAARFRAAIPGAKVSVTAPRALELRFADGTTSKQRLDNLWLAQRQLVLCTDDNYSCAT